MSLLLLFGGGPLTYPKTGADAAKSADDGHVAYNVPVKLETGNGSDSGLGAIRSPNIGSDGSKGHDDADFNLIPAGTHYQKTGADGAKGSENAVVRWAVAPASDGAKGSDDAASRFAHAITSAADGGKGTDSATLGLPKSGADGAKGSEDATSRFAHMPNVGADGSKGADAASSRFAHMPNTGSEGAKGTDAATSALIGQNQTYQKSATDGAKGTDQEHDATKFPVKLETGQGGDNSSYVLRGVGGHTFLSSADGAKSSDSATANQRKIAADGLLSSDTASSRHVARMVGADGSKIADTASSASKAKSAIDGVLGNDTASPVIKGAVNLKPASDDKAFAAESGHIAIGFPIRAETAKSSDQAVAQFHAVPQATSADVARVWDAAGFAIISPVAIPDEQAIGEDYSGIGLLTSIPDEIVKLSDSATAAFQSATIKRDSGTEGVKVSDVGIVHPRSVAGGIEGAKGTDAASAGIRVGRAGDESVNASDAASDVLRHPISASDSALGADAAFPATLQGFSHSGLDGGVGTDEGTSRLDAIVAAAEGGKASDAASLNFTGLQVLSATTGARCTDTATVRVKYRLTVSDESVARDGTFLGGDITFVPESNLIYSPKRLRVWTPDRLRVVAATALKRIIFWSNAMSTKLPAFDAKRSAETDAFAFDLVNELGAGEAIQAAAWHLAVASDSPQSDPSPSDMIAGSVTNQGTQTRIRLTGGINGAIYLVTSQVSTSLGRVLVPAARLEVSDTDL